MPGTNPDEVDAARVARVLAGQGVEFVVIGGVAAVLLGSPAMTLDFDLVPKVDEENLARLSRALFDMGAHVRAAGAVRNFPDGAWLMAGSTWNFQTDAGDVDVLFVPAGTEGFDDLVSHATPLEIEPGLSVLTASLDDLIRMKEALDRPKDRLALPILRWLRDGGPAPR